MKFLSDIKNKIVDILFALRIFDGYETHPSLHYCAVTEVGYAFIIFGQYSKFVRFNDDWMVWMNTNLAGKVRPVGSGLGGFCVYCSRKADADKITGLREIKSCCMIMLDLQEFWEWKKQNGFLIQRSTRIGDRFWVAPFIEEDQIALKLMFDAEIDDHF